MTEPRNTDVNPHQEWPIEPLCCSFHYPDNEVTAADSDRDAEYLRKPA